MANMFALILAIATLVTGIVWCIDKFKWALARHAKCAAAQAEGIAETKANKQPGWVETTASLFPVLFVVFVVRSFIYEPFQIPSGSMIPTLLIGDFILVEKYAYGIKDPITQTTLIETGHPKRSDIAVFKYPKDPSLDYIKRVVGLPGDRVIYNLLSKTVSIQPACDGGKPCDKALAVTYSDVQPSNFIQTFSGFSGNEVGNGFYQVPQGESMQGGLRLATRNETLGDVTHRILLVTQAQSQPGSYYQQPGQSQSSWVVPQGMYFMMGDNRDNSADSRYWGFVPERNLVGKATAIWMSFDKQEGEWPTGVRLSRIGSIH
ncbi:signal peptidase I [Candidatus Erwinia dacicola]|uniref:Signal peptidase I n=1 Tax=Candidatus Erwinia dacicola TaxID=252393 RepID=A0A1E7YYV6_9GAMM|nr:signal peptidase I [Candidatus Erwinia dacicola]OFC61701.1 S26 family signal peptidase [Candidatus Erwinia dacicola]RAP72199.1 signal peptidase I [Candidatus Erwinia dacicola]